MISVTLGLVPSVSVCHLGQGQGRMIMATSMTRQHFQSIADAVVWYRKGHGDAPFDPAAMAECLANEVYQYNPQFNRQRFIAACTADTPKSR